MTNSPRRLVILSIGLAAMALVWAVAPTALACDTPVYRFAMYSRQWAPYPYLVCYLHPGKEAEADAEVNAKVKKVIADQGEFTNIHFESIDAMDDEALQQVPPTVRRAWAAHEDKTQPLHVIVNPMTAVIYTGRLKSDDVGPLIDSPARQQMAKLLAGGKIVFLLLEGKDAEENAAVEKIVNEVAQLAKEGKLDTLPGAPAIKASPNDLVPRLEEPSKKKDGPAGAGADKADKIDVALLKVSRNDAKETWLLRMLMRTDADLDEVADQAMVFGIYGRARAMPPYVGKGITKKNLIHLDGLVFLSGPCSCEVKDQNPGVDLLASNDWEAAAEQMANIFGQEEGNERLLDVTNLVPSLDPNPPQPKAAPVEPSSAPEAAPSSTTDSSAAPVTGEVGGRVARYVGIGVGCLLLLVLLASVPLLKRNCGS